MSDEPSVELKRMPLWESTLDKMRELGLGFDKKFEMAWLEHNLGGCKFGTIEFGTALSSINDEIIVDGYYLSARDQGGTCYRIVPPETAEHVMDCRVRRSFRELRRAIKLCNGLLHNPTANLSDEARRRLTSKQEKNALRLVLMHKAPAIGKLVNEHNPKLLLQP